MCASISSSVMKSAFIWLTSKMSHEHGRRGACGMTIWILRFHFESLSIARGVTGMLVGSSGRLVIFVVNPRVVGELSSGQITLNDITSDLQISYEAADLHSSAADA